MRSRNILDSFRFAFSGLWYALRTQRNTRIHLTIAAAVVALGLWLGLPLTQWAVLMLTIGFVLVSEMLNTVAETLVDLVSPRYHPLARVIKDMTAGAVLLTAIVSVIVGLLVLGPPLWAWLFEVCFGMGHWRGYVRDYL
jgi:diacylglycerol kinase (ATP)